MLLAGNLTALSQVTISDKQAREIIQDKRELNTLRPRLVNLSLLKDIQEREIGILRQEINDKDLLIQLHISNYDSALERIEIIKYKKSPLILDILKGLGLVAVGYLVGIGI